jgi:HEAT repeat protein
VDRPLRSFCLIALGQIGSPAASRFLLETVEKGQPFDRPFAALALGVCGAKWSDRREEFGETLLWRWKDVKDEYERGALAIALGLLEYAPAAPALVEALKSSKSLQLKGHAATALGLLGEKDAGPLIRPLALDATDPGTQARARKALGMLDDPEAVAILLEAIRSPGNDLSTLGAAAIGLGYTGRKDAVPLLSAILTRGASTADLSRAFAAVALGRLGDKDDAPALTSLRAHCNYLATNDALRELLRIF